jgi:hypothetical protein
MPSTPPRLALASRTRSALAVLRASGFSQNTCLPALSPAIAISSCSRCGVTTATASTSERLSNSL